MAEDWVGGQRAEPENLRKEEDQMKDNGEGQKRGVKKIGK